MRPSVRAIGSSNGLLQPDLPSFRSQPYPHGPPKLGFEVEWVARQITEAFPWDEAPYYLIRDRDRIYGSVVTRRLRGIGIRDKPTAPASPWQNGVLNG
jgi:hypothetical protein